MRVKELFAWIKERHSIYEKKTAGKPKPWTKNRILQNYRFCNVYRELDTVTKWIATNWRDPYSHDPDLWFAMVVARLFNWPPTLERIGYPVPWAKKNDASVRRNVVVGIAHHIQDEGKLFSSAYIVSTNGRRMDKVEYLVTQVLDPLWADRKAIQADIYGNARDAHTPTLYTVHKALMQYQGLGSFMAAQVVADLKYVEPLRGALDWSKWAASGPGSRRGLNRVFNFSIDAPWSEASWLANLQLLHREIEPLIAKAGMPPLHAQDLQNCLCEFDKYERTRLLEGRPRNTYPGGK